MFPNLLVTLILFAASLASAEPAVLLPYNPSDCKNLSIKNAQNVSLSWLKVSKKIKQAGFNVSFMCSNKQTIRTDVGIENEFVKGVNCASSTLVTRSETLNGELAGTSYYNLATCEKLFSADSDHVSEHWSSDQSQLVLTLDTPEDDDGSGADMKARLVILDCRKKACVKVKAFEFQNVKFEGFVWKGSNLFEVRKIHVPGATPDGPETVKQELCAFDLMNSSSGLICKK